MPTGVGGISNAFLPLARKHVTKGSAWGVEAGSDYWLTFNSGFDLMGTATYSGQIAYNQSKLANVLFTYELARRLASSGVTATVLHPGMTSTGFGSEDTARGWRPLIALMRPFMKSPRKGAETSVFLAGSPDAQGMTGQYFVDRTPRRSSDRSYDVTTADRLWQVSNDLVGLSGGLERPPGL